MIVVVDNAFSDELCDKVKAFIDRRTKDWDHRAYGNLNNVICKSLYLKDLHDQDAKAMDQCIYEELTRVIKDRLLPAIMEKIPEAIKNFKEGVLRDVGYELRKVTGATRRHYDGELPCVVGGHLRYRIASICVCLSDSADKLVFPVQEAEVQYKKGMLVCFPVSWAFPHNSIYGGFDSYRMQTWLTTQ